MKTLKKLFSVSAIVALLGTLAPMYAFGANYDAELQDAYAYAYKNHITDKPSIDAADMYGNLNRVAMAKMIANYATKVLGLKADTSRNCTFSDVTAALDAEYDNGVTNACQLGLMGIDDNGNVKASFDPKGTVTRAQFATALSRAISQAEDGEAIANGNPYYRTHIAYLNGKGIVKSEAEYDVNSVEKRGYVMLMMMRADKSYTRPEGCTSEETLQCITKFLADDNFDRDACIAACNGDETQEEEQDPEEVKAGTLNVTVKSEEGGEFPQGVSSLTVATYTLKAVDEDIDITSLVIEEGGYGTPVDAALFINGQRVSKVKNLAALNTEYTLNLTNAYTVKAGKSVDVELRVSDRLAAGAQQFNISLVNVNSSAEKVKLPSNLKSNTFKLIVNPTIELVATAPTALDNPKAGTKGADLFEIKLSNVANDQNVELNSISLVANNKDVAEDLENVKLLVDNEVIANGKINKKDLTFVLNTPYVIEKGKAVTLTVRADVIGGAGETFNYTLEDAMDLSATAVAYNASVRVVDDSTVPGVVYSSLAPNKLPFSNFTISAGRVTIERTNPTSNTYTQNRKNLFLGSFTIIDNNKNDLTLNSFDIVFNRDVMADDIESVKVRYGSNTAGLIEGSCSGNPTVCTFDDEKAINGKLTVYAYADTTKTTFAGPNFTAQAKNFDITENENDEDVTDISLPNSWMMMSASTSALNLTNVKLSDEEFAKGAESVDAVSFKVKTTAAEGVKMKKLEFTAVDEMPATCETKGAGWDVNDNTTRVVGNCTNGFIDAGDHVVNSNTIRNATLYVGNKTYPATVNAGTIKVSDTIELAADTTTVFTLKVDLASNPTVSPFHYTLTSYEAEDTSADRNDLTPAVLPLTGIDGRTVTVKQTGTLSITTKATAAANKYAKSILAGTTADVMEYTLKASYEDLKVINGTVVLELNGLTANYAQRIDDIQLVYGEDVVASDADLDTTVAPATATFTNVNFDITSTETPLTVKVVTKKMTNNNDHAAKGVYVDSITFTQVYGKVSGNALAAGLTNPSDSKSFDVVPATVVTSVKEQTASKAVLLFTVDKGDNTKTAGAAFDLSLDTLVLDVTANTKGLNSLTVKNDNNVVLYTTSIVANTDTTPADGIADACAAAGKQDLKVVPADGKTLCLEKSAAAATEFVIEDGTEYTFTYMVGDANTPSFTVDLTNVVFDSTFANAVDLSNRMATSLNLLTK